MCFLGGKLGFFCHHAYASVNGNKSPDPETLKGTDMEIWEVMSLLGLRVTVRPLMHMQEYLEMYEGKEWDPDYFDNDIEYDSLGFKNTNGYHSQCLSGDKDENGDEDEGKVEDEDDMDADKVTKRREAKFDCPYWVGPGSRHVRWLGHPTHRQLHETYLAVSHSILRPSAANPLPALSVVRIL